MDDGNSWIGLLFLVLAVVVYAVLYGFGAALQSVNTGVLEGMSDEGDKKAEGLLHIQQSPFGLIRTIQFVTCLVGILIGSVSLAYVNHQCRILFALVPEMPHIVVTTLAYVVSILLIAFILICFGGVIPKRMAVRNPAKFCLRTYSFVNLMLTLFMPFTWLIECVAYLILRLMGIDIHAKDDNVTEEDIMYMVNEGHEQGVLEASEAEMITNIFEFDDKDAIDIMTHRTSMVAIDGTITLREAMQFIVNESIHSRFPVYGEDIDDIIGILHMRDAIHFSAGSEYLDQPIKDIEGLLREPVFIPETKNVNALFKEMQSQKIHMEIVIDEYGQTAGVVTMEDVLEEIVGNIMDEYDNEEPDIVDKGNNTYELSGMTTLEDVEEELKIKFDEEDTENFETLNGFLISRLGHVPKNDERAEVPFGCYTFRIAKVENKVIQQVYAVKEKPEPSETRTGQCE